MGKHDEWKKPANAGGHVLFDHVNDLKLIDYIRIANLHLKKGHQQAAYTALKRAAVQYPNDPFILSYYGSLQSIVGKKFRDGIANCSRAIVLFKKKSLGGGMERCAVFYLNLGRAYLAAGKKKDAIDAFKRGLRYDNDYETITKKLQELGTRKRPPVPFLDRSNPINKYLGMILHQEKKKHAARDIIKTGTGMLWTRNQSL